MLLMLFAITAQAQSEPKDAASDAFYAQTNGDYDRLSHSYDNAVTSFFSRLSEQLIESLDSDPTSRSALTSIFQTTDPQTIRSLGEKKIFARMYAHIFSSKLADEEQELLRNAQFEYSSTSYLEDGTAEVQYVVAFTSEAKTKPKTMLLKKNEGRWLITMKPELLEAIKTAINPDHRGP